MFGTHTPLLIVLLITTIVSAQDNPLTNKDVIDMVKAGLPESTIILNIERSVSKFDTSAKSLIELNKLGISAKVLDAMINAKQTGYSDSQPTPNRSQRSESQALAEQASVDPVLSQMTEPGIYAVDNGKVSLIEPTVFSGSKSNPLLGALTYGIAKTKIRAKVQRKTANTQTESKS